MVFRTKTLILVVLILLASLTLSLIPAQAQTTTTVCSGKVTTLAAEGVPNLFRLGLKYGVPWQAIQTASGVVDVRRVQPDQLLCVPGISSVSTTTVTVTVAVVTPVPTAIPLATATPVVSSQPVFTEAGYCAQFMGGAVPIDLGSCQLELLSIQLGIQAIVEWGIVCVPRDVRQTTTGYQQCSVRGDLWLSLPPGAVIP
jgi:hypothetical protein